ncbi:MAG: homocysteine S-methyltransferase family protein [Candidatus Heimdallarchaeota archaeon]
MLTSRKSILDLIKEQVVLLDGAMGSELIAAGLPAGTPSESWNVTAPEKVKQIHKNYFDAGSNAVFTNTFGGTRIKLDAQQHGNKVEEYNTKAVEIVRSVCPDDCFVGGDIGPTGKFLPPVGKATIDDFSQNFLEQAKILAENGVDFFFIETMMDIKEAEAAVLAARKVANIPIFASITYQKTKRGYFTVMGNSIDQCVTILEKAGADVIGANCTIGSDDMIELIIQLRDATKLPISAKPNAGMPELRKGETIYPTIPEDFARDIVQIVNAKANVVGGCCGTDPQYIRKITELLKGK